MRCLLVIVAFFIQAEAGSSIPNELHNITSVSFNKLETFLSTSSSVYHMEIDLYKDDGSILFSDNSVLKSTNGKTTSTVASGFTNVFGFKQINSTNVLVVDYSKHCITMVHREHSSKEVIAGVCGTAGYADGKPGKFSYPWSIEEDVRTPGQYLVTDLNNAALRLLDIHYGVVSTVIKTGFNNVRGLAWYHNHLLLANQFYISEAVWGENETVTNTKLTQGSSYGYQDGEFSKARFYTPYELTPFQEGFFLVADYNNQKLRFLDMNKKRVVPVCIGANKHCSTSETLYSYPASVLKTKYAVYIGFNRRIIKLSGFGCYLSNSTVYIYPDQKTVSVKLDADTVGVFSKGEYKHVQNYGSISCSFYVRALESPVIRTVAFRADYAVACDSVNNHISKAFLQAILAHRNGELQTICGKACEMSTSLQPWYTCNSKTLTVTWPTDTVYPVDVKDVPDKFSSSILTRLKGSSINDAEMVILSHIPPLIKPNKDANGETIKLVLTSSCADQSKVYNERSDSCVTQPV